MGQGVEDDVGGEAAGIAEAAGLEDEAEGEGDEDEVNCADDCAAGPSGGGGTCPSLRFWSGTPPMKTIVT